VIRNGLQGEILRSSAKITILSSFLGSYSPPPVNNVEIFLADPLEGGNCVVVSIIFARDCSEVQENLSAIVVRTRDL
jgi:hypothetical protein